MTLAQSKRLTLLEQSNRSMSPIRFAYRNAGQLYWDAGFTRPLEPREVEARKAEGRISLIVLGALQ